MGLEGVASAAFCATGRVPTLFRQLTLLPLDQLLGDIPRNSRIHRVTSNSLLMNT